MCWPIYVRKLTSCDFENFGQGYKKVNNALLLIWFIKEIKSRCWDSHTTMRFHHSVIRKIWNTSTSGFPYLLTAHVEWQLYLFVPEYMAYCKDSYAVFDSSVISVIP